MSKFTVGDQVETVDQKMGIVVTPHADGCKIAITHRSGKTIHREYPDTELKFTPASQQDQAA